MEDNGGSDNRGLTVTFEARYYISQIRFKI